MVHRVHPRPAAFRSLPRRAAIALAAVVVLGGLVALSGCGSSLRDGSDARADVDATTHTSCASTVLAALSGVATRVYRQGIASERTASAMHMITRSSALRKAVEAGDASATRAAARSLLATGHMTNLRVTAGGRVLADLGGAAVAPLTGELTGTAGKPIASFQTSVWADGGLIAELNGIAEAQTVVRSVGATPGAGRDVAGTVALPPGELPARGTLTRSGTAYEFTSFAARAYPAGDPLRVYLIRPVASTSTLCGSNDEETTYNTISHIAHLIYDGEAGRRTHAQIDRVQHSRPLLRAVARKDPTATRAAVEALLHEHVVRLRVSAGGRLLSDVGGPFVLAPVTAPLRRGGRTIGSFVMSIQDDEGYKRLAQRLVGVDVLMYMGSRLVKSTIGFSPGPIPTSGPVSYRGKRFRAYTFTAEAFPSGPLRITVLIPMPYS
ncbi:MAG: hypothetical protein QOI18_1443 [Solirubrobacteraceae bacterium]|nr:hypothetical protein [Solirubrobacteraceae bacterium]